MAEDRRTWAAVKVLCLASALVALAHGDSAAFRDAVGVEAAGPAPSCPDTSDAGLVVGSPSSRAADVVVVEVAAVGVIVGVGSARVADTGTCLRWAKCRCWVAGPGDTVAGRRWHKRQVACEGDRGRRDFGAERLAYWEGISRV